MDRQRSILDSAAGGWEASSLFDTTVNASGDYPNPGYENTTSIKHTVGDRGVVPLLARLSTNIRLRLRPRRYWVNQIRVIAVEQKKTSFLWWRENVTFIFY